MKKKQLAPFYAALKTVQDHKGTKFSYAIAKNMTIVETEMKVIAESFKNEEKFDEFEAKRIQLAKDLCDKNEDGSDKILVENNVSRYSLKKNQKKFDTELAKLREEYKETIEIQEKKTEEFEKMLEDESGLTFHNLKLENVPETISPAELNGILEIIEE